MPNMTRSFFVVFALVVCAAFLNVTPCFSQGNGSDIRNNDWQTKSTADTDSNSDDNQTVLLEDVVIGKHKLQFYVSFSYDSAVLGFVEKNEAGKMRYFPLFGSTYRGLPAVELEVFASKKQDEVWISSSWVSYEKLGYHKLGTDLASTQYGQISAFDKPTPSHLSGGSSLFPSMNPEDAIKVKTISIPKM